MQNNIIYNQRFNKAANDIETIITEFRKLINQDETTPDDLVRIQLLKNELRTATNSLLEEVEDTDKCKVTLFTELTRSDIEALKSITVDSSALAAYKEISIKLDEEGTGKELVNQFIELIKELKEYSE